MYLTQHMISYSPLSNRSAVHWPSFTQLSEFGYKCHILPLHRYQYCGLEWHSWYSLQAGWCRGWNLMGARLSITRQTWGPPSLLYNGYLVIPPR